MRTQAMYTKRRTLSLFIGIILLNAGPSHADCVINIRLSIKVILNPSTGEPPMGVFPALIEAVVVPGMNGFFGTYARGYRFELVDPVTLVGGVGDTEGPSQWFDAPRTDCFLLRDAALDDPIAYAWNFSAINIYINNSGGEGAIACFDDVNDDGILIVSRDASTNSSTYLHELGHYFGLCHTHGCDCENCSAQQTGVCHTVPGDDGIADTVGDLDCWDLDDIATHNFGADYSSLSPSQQKLCDDVWLNVMSYHPQRNQLTEQQLDLWADTANTRDTVLDGATLFADPAGTSSGDGTSANPFDTVAAAVAAADPAGGDIILLRPGSYPELVTISQPVCVRATRAGPATIGD